MHEDHSVLVHAFQCYRHTFEDVEVSTFKATPDAIVALGGEPIAGTAEWVSRDEIDSQGRYRRLATGWGDLGD